MNAMTNPSAAASAKAAAWMLVWSWQAAILLACVWAGLKVFRVKSPALRHQVWLFALIAVAAMPALSGVVQSLPLPKPNNKALTPLRWHKDSDSVFALLREIAYASMRRDTEFFERVLDDDYVGVGPDGATRNKAEEIAEVDRLDSIKKFEFDDLRVSGDDDMAFATFLATVHFQTDGQDSTAQYRYTVNFIKKDVPLDVKVEAEHIEGSGGAQVSCLKCHSGRELYKMPLAKVKEKIVKEMAVAIAKSGSDEHIQGEAKTSFKHADVLLLHQRQLKIAAIHMSRKN